MAVSEAQGVFYFKLLPMALDNSPAFQWYPKDALSSIRLSMLTLEEEGAYRRALDYCWLHGSIPADPIKLIRLIGKGCTLEIAEAIIPMFEVLDGQLYHERLEQERSKQKAFREKQAENGKRGGRPKQNPSESQNKGLGYFGETQTEAKKSSSVSNLQSSNSIKGKDINKGFEAEICWPENFTEEHKKLWLEYEQTRESIPKPPYSPAARQLALNEFVYSASTDPKKYTDGLQASIRGAWVSPKWFAPKVEVGKQPEVKKSTYDRTWKGYGK
jgi:uncharacterized protein YdaU (DUF1376 family)